MKFLQFSQVRLTEKTLGRHLSTDWDTSYFWRDKLNDPGYAESIRIEEMVEEVRRTEYPLCPSRKMCMFLFDKMLSPEGYFAAMGRPVDLQRQYNLVEVEVDDADSKIVRVNRLLLESLLAEEHSDDEVRANARVYWRGSDDAGLNEEVLFQGTFTFTNILRKADERFQPFLRNLYEF